jgi:hypothetical protein
VLGLHALLSEIGKWRFSDYPQRLDWQRQRCHESGLKIAAILEGRVAAIGDRVSLRQTSRRHHAPGHAPALASSKSSHATASYGTASHASDDRDVVHLNGI